MTPQTDTHPCKRHDLQVEVVANADVDDRGDAILDQDVLLTAGIHAVPKPYFCTGPCDQDFETWEDALQHLEEQEKT